MLRLRYHRLRAGITQVRLSVMSGVALCDLIRAEGGQLRLSGRQLDRLAAALSVPAETLLDDASPDEAASVPSRLSARRHR